MRNATAPGVERPSATRNGRLRPPYTQGVPADRWSRDGVASARKREPHELRKPVGPRPPTRARRDGRGGRRQRVTRSMPSHSRTPRISTNWRPGRAGRSGPTEPRWASPRTQTWATPRSATTSSVPDASSIMGPSGSTTRSHPARSGRRTLGDRSSSAAPVAAGRST